MMSQAWNPDYVFESEGRKSMSGEAEAYFQSFVLSSV